MTPAQFSAWSERFFPPRKQIGDAMAREIGIDKGPAKRRREGSISVSKHEALACAHYALGFPLPTPAGDVEAFARWFGRHFATANSVNLWLDLSNGFISFRLRGYAMRGEERVSTVPDATLIRALDWVHRVGPVAPWFEETGQ